MKKIVPMVFILTCILGMQAIQTFGTTTNELTDVSKTDWYYDALNDTVSKGIIDGYPDKTFRPQNNITRAEFSKTIRTALKLDLSVGNSFGDTNSHWAKDEVYTLVRNDIINKDEYGKNYLPDTKISRIEMAKMVVRAIGLGNEAEKKAGESTKFVDDNSINSMDKGYIIIATENGIIKGYEDNTFRANNEATRAETSQMLINMLEAIDKLEPIIKLPTFDGITNTKDLASIPVEETKYDALKDYQITNFRGVVTYEVNDVVKADTTMFPIQHDNFVITGIERLKAKNAPYYNDKSIYFMHSGNQDAIILHGYATASNDDTGVTPWFWLTSLRIDAVDNKGQECNVPITQITNVSSTYNNTKAMYSNYVLGEHPKVDMNKNFTTMFMLKDGFSVDNVEKIIILATDGSTKDGLEIKLK